MKNLGSTVAALPASSGANALTRTTLSIALDAVSLGIMAGTAAVDVVAETNV